MHGRAKGMSNAIHSLRQLSTDAKARKYPEVPAEWLPRSSYSDRTANGLTKCILDFLQFSGWQAERVSNTGRAVIDFKGHRGLKWLKGSGTNGTADISATIAGKSVKIEVKIGPDRQSDVQRRYQQAIERAGGIYVIAKTFQGFWDWYTKTFTHG